jgi:Tol biopolymer transport system component
MLLLGIILTPAGAEAQYFGRNKVQYKGFEFQVLKTEHFDIYFYPEEQGAAGQAARMAERWYARLSRVLSHELRDRQPVMLYASHADFEQTNIVSGIIEEGTGGVTEGLKRRVVLPLAATLAETDHVLGHELVHAFQYDMASRDRQSGTSTLDRLPLWLIEGMAEYLSIGPVDPHTAMWIRDASRKEKLPDIEHLDDPDLFPYRWGQALWAYLAGRWGDDVVARVYRDALRSGNASKAIENTAGMNSKEVSREWHAAIHAQYDPIFKTTSRADTYGSSLSGEKPREHSMNVSPALSPDGRQIVYFSERSFLSVDLYLADVQTGKVIRQLVSTTQNPHFTSLQFISSAGSWNPNGRQFVFGAIRDGKATLTILDIESGRIMREIPFPALGEILNPSWSPDARRITFSATAGGFSDLFIYDLEEDSLHQLTNDAYADLQPVWSPDGLRLAFVTDRFSTDLPTLKAGAYGLATFAMDTGVIEALPTFAHGKTINPQWAPDGRLYFLSDRSGLTNVYVINTATREVRQITNLDAGASGVTALSPALSFAGDAKRLAFSAYDDGRFSIYFAHEPELLAGGPILPDNTDVRADVLPPQQRASEELLSLLRNESIGLPEKVDQAERYHPDLSLDFVGQSQVEVGVSSFGPSFGGGISFMWSDMLGNHNLRAMLNANTYGMGLGDLAKNTGALLAYQNLTHRWNWGLAVQQSPSIAGGFVTGVTVAGDQPVLVEQSITERQTYRGMGGGGAYPFSQTHRIEFGAGYDNVSFDRKVRTLVSSLRTGAIISDDTSTETLANSLHLGTVSAAAVIDSSTFGAIGPVAGRRARLEVAPTFGSLSLTSTTADYRRYFMPASFYTIATRVLHVGRYGPGSEDSRLLPLFIGYPELVRGYDIGSFTAAECTAGASSTCQEFDRLLGSRMLIGNIELRFPLLRPFGVRSGMYGPIPVEFAVFADGGVAWNRGERPSFLGGDRKAVSSGGITFRVNLFGFAVAQVDLARPFQRPGRGWLWGFNFAPAF